MAKKTKKPEEAKQEALSIEGDYAFTPFGKAKVVKKDGEAVTVEFADKTQQTYKKSEITFTN